MNSAKERVRDLLTEHTSIQGFEDSSLPGVRFLRSTVHVPRSPMIYRPGIIIIGQGRKVGHLGARKFVYDANHYLVMAMPLPFECETFGTPVEPLLGLSIEVTSAMVADLLLQMDDSTDTRGPAPVAVESAELDLSLADATARLLQCLNSADDAKILSSQIVREIVYRVLQGPLGRNLRALAAPQSYFGQISRVLNRIHADSSQPYDVESLAREAGMSSSTFRVRFKEVTASSPLQYLKAIRLNRARALMVNEGIGAANAAMRVGYESASQFSREFKRYFGGPPASVADALRSSLTRLG